MQTTISACDALLARMVREEVRGELHERLLPSVQSFLASEITTVQALASDCQDSAQKSQLARLIADLAVVQQGLEAFVATSVALLQDRQ